MKGWALSIYSMTFEIYIHVEIGTQIYIYIYIYIYISAIDIGNSDIYLLLTLGMSQIYRPPLSIYGVRSVALYRDLDRESVVNYSYKGFSVPIDI